MGLDNINLVGSVVVPPAPADAPDQFGAATVGTDAARTPAIEYPLEHAVSPRNMPPIEAQWTEEGASCLTKPRIIFNSGKEEAPKKTTKMLDAFCKASNKDCKLVQTWIDEAKKCTKRPGGNSTSTTDHVLADCQPCTGSSCPLESRNVK